MCKLSIFLVETDMPWYLARWAVGQSDSGHILKSEIAFKEKWTERISVGMKDFAVHRIYISRGTRGR
jgi:hypothetical protein